MQLTLSHVDDHTLAHTTGPIDESAREVFREHLHPIVGQPGSKLIIDLTNSPRINSQGVSNLVTLVAHANTSGSRVILRNVATFIAVVFSVTRLDQFFEIEPSAPKALPAQPLTDQRAPALVAE